MPHFHPFRGLRYSTTSTTDIGPLSSPPYDVFDEAVRARFAREPHNIVALDYPVGDGGPGMYEECARTLAAWVSEGVLVEDENPSFTLYRMVFADEVGRRRTIVGVIGALEVVDEGAGGVLPHEQTTPKARTDRLDLTRATRANLSPVWGLSLSAGLTALLEEPGVETARCTDENGVLHIAERIDDSRRVAAISEFVEANPVLIADGHHRYAISRTYRDECRATGGPRGSEETMTFVQELVEEQLSIAAIHRLYDEDPDTLLETLSGFYEPSPAGRVDRAIITKMEERGAICLVGPQCEGTWLFEREGAFEGVRGIDSARLEHALSSLAPAVRYQHGVDAVLAALAAGSAGAAVLIRPVSLAEIERTARTRLLMPPKSTFFAPKLRTGMVMRLLED